jgi:hypothetical protein
LTLKRQLVPFFRFNHLRCWPLATVLVMCFLLAGCATRKATPPPTVTYPPTQESALRVLHSLPQGSYARIQTITVAAVVGKQFDSALSTARQTAAQKGANALVILRDAEFKQRIGKQTLRVRRLTYLAIWRP